MDASKVKSLPTSPSALPVLDPRAKAILEIVEQSEQGTTKEQLAAFAYAWGSGGQEASEAYRQNFERKRNTFLSASGSADSRESLTAFNNTVRAGIRAQLPDEIGAKLGELQRACKTKLDTGGGAYTYAQMKAEMLCCTRRFIGEQGHNVPRISNAVPSAKSAVLPPSSTSTTSNPQFQQSATQPSFIAVPKPVPGPDSSHAPALALIDISKGKATIDQLNALAYAWGSDKKEAVKTYRKDFERCKSVFFSGAGDSVESRKMFNHLVRTGISAQLPDQIGTRLQNRQSACESAVGEKGRAYTYDQMKADMLSCIRDLIREQGMITPQLDTTSAPASLPSSASSTSMAQPQHTDPGPVIAPTTAALTAPPHLEFLNSFPAEWRSRPEWKSVIASMETYLSKFASYRGGAQFKLLEADPTAIAKAIQSIQLHTSLPPDEAARVAWERDIVNIAMSRPFDQSINEKVLGCKTSRMMESKPAQTPGNQLSLSMRAPLLTVDGRTCTPLILSVSAPALDTPNQPEWGHYVKGGHLDANAYRIAFETLAGHIKQYATKPENKGYQVILSGFGLANFLAGLAPQERKAAVDIGAKAFLNLIRELRADGVEVAYTDYSGSSPPWPQVNQALGSDKLQCVGSIPDKWINDRQIIVNAWDPHALVGNGCASDNSLDGYIGRNSLVHETHALACALHAHGFIP
jgi:hypothetical protein